MIAEMLRACDFDPAAVEVPADHDPWLAVARAITAAEARQAVDRGHLAEARRAGPGAGHHRHRWRRQVVADRRTGAPLPADFPS
jgi:hypothetical protein